MIRRYVHSVGNDVPLHGYAGASLLTPFYYHSNHQGSIVAMSGPGGAGAIHSYNEYGFPGLGNTDRFQYTGQIWLAELGMHHYKAQEWRSRGE